MIDEDALLLRLLKTADQLRYAHPDRRRKAIDELRENARRALEAEGMTDIEAFMEADAIAQRLTSMVQRYDQQAGAANQGAVVVAERCGQ